MPLATPAGDFLFGVTEFVHPDVHICFKEQLWSSWLCPREQKAEVGRAIPDLGKGKPNVSVGCLEMV